MQVWAYLLVVTFKILWRFDGQENQAKNDKLPCRETRSSKFEIHKSTAQSCFAHLRTKFLEIVDGNAVTVH